MASGRVLIADTTLRDEHLISGDPWLLAERGGLDVWRSRPLPLGTRIEVARELAALGVDVIEAGFAEAPESAAAIRALASEFEEEGPIVSGLVNAFAEPEHLREAAQAVAAADRPRVHIYANASDLVDETGDHRRRPPILLAEALTAIECLKGEVDDIEFSPPQTNVEAIEVAAVWARGAIEAGARTINLRCVLDGPEPEPSLALISELRRLVPLAGVTLSADLFASHLRGAEAFNLATGCAEAALEAGCGQVKCAFHGIAATPGHPSLEMLAFQTWLRNHLHESHLWTSVDTTRLLRTSSVVAAAKGFELPPSQPLVGEDTTAPDPADFPEDPVERALTATATRIVFKGLGIPTPAWLDEFVDPATS
jgi:2-isopropylmalate synthase